MQRDSAPVAVVADEPKPDGKTVTIDEALTARGSASASGEASVPLKPLTKKEIAAAKSAAKKQEKEAQKVAALAKKEAEKEANRRAKEKAKEEKRKAKEGKEKAKEEKDQAQEDAKKAARKQLKERRKSIISTKATDGGAETGILDDLVAAAKIKPSNDHGGLPDASIADQIVSGNPTGSQDANLTGEEASQKKKAEVCKNDQGGKKGVGQLSCAEKLGEKLEATAAVRAPARALPPAKKRRGLSLDEKCESIHEHLLNTGKIFTLKELEAVGPKLGVITQAVKDVVLLLVKEKRVSCER